MSSRKVKKNIKKCYSCRGEYEDNGTIYCEKCVDKPDRAKSYMSTFTLERVSDYPTNKRP